MIELVLPEATPSLNVWQRMHWAVRKREQHKWAMIVYGALLIAGWSRISARAFGKRRLTIERFGVRALDPDNACGGAKPVIDELRHLGLLLDDTPEMVELVVRSGKKKRGEDPHTRITLEDL